MSYSDKIMSRPPPIQAEADQPWDSARHMAPDPNLPLEDQLAWFSAAGLVLALNASEVCRRKAAGAGDRAVQKRQASSPPGKGVVTVW